MKTVISIGNIERTCMKNHYGIITVVSRRYAPPFATLASVQNVGGGLYAGCNNFFRDYTLPSDKARLPQWGVEAKHKVSPNARRRDTPGTSGRLTSFSIEE